MTGEEFQLWSAGDRGDVNDYTTWPPGAEKHPGELAKGPITGNRLFLGPAHFFTPRMFETGASLPLSSSLLWDRAHPLRDRVRHRRLPVVSIRWDGRGWKRSGLI